MAKDIGSETVTVVRSQRVDRLDPASGTAVEHDISGCVLLPRSSHEEERGWVIVEGLQVFAPYDSDVLATDQVRAQGELWNVDGAVGHYKDAKGKGKVTIFYLSRRSTS